MGHSRHTKTSRDTGTDAGTGRRDIHTGTGTLESHGLTHDDRC